jgi:hypothetical protein
LRKVWNRWARRHGLRAEGGEARGCRCGYEYGYGREAVLGDGWAMPLLMAMLMLERNVAGVAVGVGVKVRHFV